MKVHDLLEEALREADLDEAMRNRLDMRYIGMAFSAIYNEVKRAEDITFSNRLKKASDIWHDDKFKTSLRRARPIRGTQKAPKTHEKVERNVRNKPQGKQRKQPRQRKVS